MYGPDNVTQDWFEGAYTLATAGVNLLRHFMAPGAIQSANRHQSHT